jgi:hypothetical protein
MIETRECRFTPTRADAREALLHLVSLLNSRISRSVGRMARISRAIANAKRAGRADV